MFGSQNSRNRGSKINKEQEKISALSRSRTQDSLAFEG
jgi:hypothetical protein